MWPGAEDWGVEPRPEAAQDGGSIRRGSDAGKSAAAGATKERPGLADPGRGSAIQVPRAGSEVGGRLGTMARAGMERWRDRLALVTGASGGIGAAVARALVQQGLKVVGCARTVGNIEELAAECKSAGYPGTLIPYRCDLSNEEDILSMFSAVRAQHSGVDICINNAGLARPDTLLSGSTSGWKDMLNVNVLALSICTREAYQSMKERKVDDGHIININSMSGHRVEPQPVVHFYSASKYAVTALTEGLRQELREAQTHIRATCISPGVVETRFAFKLLDKEPEKAAATYENIKVGPPSGPSETTHSPSEGRGNPGLQTPTLLASLFPLPEGWGGNMDAGEEALNGGRDLESLLSSTLPPGSLSVSNLRMWQRLSSTSSAPLHTSRLETFR